MKRVFISLALAAILILGMFGGVALAAPPGTTPLEMWEQILARIGDPTTTTQGWPTVSDALEDIDSSIDGVSTGIGNQITQLGSDIGVVNSNLQLVGDTINDNIDSLPTMTSAIGHIHSESPQNDFYEVYNSPAAGIQLFKVTIRIGEINPNYGYVRVTEKILGEEYLIGIDGTTEAETRLDLEFTGSGVVIEFSNGDTGGGEADPIDFSYGVTITSP